MWSERSKSSFCMVSNIASMGKTKGVIFGFFSERCTVLQIFASRRRNWHQPTSKATGWPLQVASAVSLPLIGPGSRSVKRWKRTLFRLLFRRKHTGKDKRGIIFSFFSESYIHRPSNIRCLPEKKLNAFVRSYVICNCTSICMNIQVGTSYI
jgi:hypothetical protein